MAQLELCAEADATGTKTWCTARLLAAAVARAPDGPEPLAVRGRSVLELGAGCGLCGIVSSKLSPQLWRAAFRLAWAARRGASTVHAPAPTGPPPKNRSKSRSPRPRTDQEAPER